MPIAVGVIVRKLKEKIYADTRHFDLDPGDEVILETEHGLEAGVVCEKEKNIVIENGKTYFSKIVRELTDEDREKVVDNLRRSRKAFNIVLDKVREHEIDLKLTSVRYIFDRSKLFVYYTSESRVDFRELIKDLGHILKTRIQMVQIGVRDESKMIGGLGTCGRTLCCQSFFGDFNSVTIDMAKEQDLSLNTSKLSGLCGRLMCCIAYENEYYKLIKDDLPRIGGVIHTPMGDAKFAAVDCIKLIITADFGNDRFEKFDTETIKKLNPGVKR
ncbi:MAG: stage 0 sporulation protein [Elusimicrobiota bacterium]|jgi:cell fate regulator YaaT (PSP1 superfamily)|nr:stage 0 sporulation protein [Elusimicrobiota bacterium]